MVSEWNWLLVAVVHEGKTVVGRGDMTLNEGDHVLLMAKADQTEEPIRLMGFTSRPAKRVMIFGSTRLARLATALFLESGLAVTLMLADKYPKALVVCADPTDPKVLQDEGIERTDAVLALTGWDEVNILACLVSKALGVSTAVARFTRVQYVGLLEGVGIDAAVSSRLAAASAILRFVRRGRIHSVATFEDTDAEAIEIEVAPTSQAVGRTLRTVRLPRSSIVGGVLRDGRAFVPRGSTVIEPGDRLIVFTLPGSISDVEKLLAG
jgi:trk system potassium uptake protein TrkA